MRRTFGSLIGHGRAEETGSVEVACLEFRSKKRTEHAHLGPQEPKMKHAAPDGNSKNNRPEN